MSDTPRTDAIDFGDQKDPLMYSNLWHLSRTLERENTSLREQLRLAQEQLKEAQANYKRTLIVTDAALPPPTKVEGS